MFLVLKTIKDIFMPHINVECHLLFPVSITDPSYPPEYKDCLGVAQIVFDKIADVPNYVK